MDQSGPSDVIYLDHAATTALDPAVFAAMQPYFTDYPGNPSSIHQIGRKALQAIDDARMLLCAVLGCSQREIIITSGGSESDNLAIKGVALAQQQRGKGQHIISTAIEHHAVLDALEYLQHFGFEVTLLPVDRAGQVCVADVQAAMRPDTVLVSVMYANNETGVIQPIAEIGALCRERGIPFHTDAVQAVGLLPIQSAQLNVDLLTLAAHKFYGPKGIGLLYIRRGTPLLPQINGGGQERRRRAGTENTPAIVGMAVALERAEQQRDAYAQHCTARRDQLIQGVLQRIPDTWLNGHATHRLPNNANLGFAGVDAESILLLLDQHGICASSGSACTSGSLDPSHVLLAMGLAPSEASASVRLTVGRATTAAQIERTLAVLADVVQRLRQGA